MWNNDTDIKPVNIAYDRRYWIGTEPFSQALFLYLNCIWVRYSDSVNSFHARLLK